MYEIVLLRHPFPCPTTFRVALAHYVDIAAPIKPHVLKAIAEFSGDEEEKSRLIRMSVTEGDGQAEYNEYVIKGRRCIVDILSEFPTCKPPVDLLLEILPRLQVSHYCYSDKISLRERKYK